MISARFQVSLLFEQVYIYIDFISSGEKIQVLKVIGVELSEWAYSRQKTVNTTDIQATHHTKSPSWEGHVQL